jgi:hypothetical protein
MALNRTLSGLLSPWAAATGSCTSDNRKAASLKSRSLDRVGMVVDTALAMIAESSLGRYTQPFRLPTVTSTRSALLSAIRVPGASKVRAPLVVDKFARLPTFSGASTSKMIRPGPGSAAFI